MANAVPSFIGADNGVDSTVAEQRALYLKVFSGEVLTAFEKQTVFLDKHQVRTISKGKQAQFPVIGRMPDAEYHTPGAEITGQEVQQSEVTIDIEKLLISHIFLADIDEAMSHFEVRGKYSQMMGHELALKYDNHVARNIVAAAAASSPITADTSRAGTVITDADLISGTDATKAAGWIDLLYTAAETFDNKFVTSGTRYCVLKPADYYFLVKHVQSNGFSAINRDYGGQGSFAEGNIIKIAGIQLVPTPMLPTSNYSTEDYNAVDCRNTNALIFTDEAGGTVKLMDVSIQSQWDIRRQGTLLVARYAMGHGKLRNECAIQARSSAPV